jgi:hypothetical protein
MSSNLDDLQKKVSTQAESGLVKHYNAILELEELLKEWDAEA